MFGEKTTRGIIRKINREIKLLKKHFRRTEIRPCQNDAGLREKQKDLEAILVKINALEKERDRCIMDANRKSE